MLNVLPPGSGGKGTALLRALARAGLGRALFVGDDVTDEDALAQAAAIGSIGVRIGPATDSRAQLFLGDQGDIDALLNALIEHAP